MAYASDKSAGGNPAGTANMTTGNSGTTSDGIDFDVAVVGGGLAGLTAACFAARGGAKVVLLERTEDAGGRAATHDDGGYRFNVGPHALYDGASAARAFAELGVAYTGRKPAASGGLAFHRGALHALPGGFVSLLTTGLLGPSGKLELARVLGSLAKIDPATLAGRTLREWLDATFRDATVRSLVEALMRLTAYADDPSRSCAQASVRQLQAGLARGVLYLDGGWTTLVAGLKSCAKAHGVSLRTGCRVTKAAANGDGVRIETADGVVRARLAVLAVPPAVAASLAEGDGAATIASAASSAVPVKAACLDLGLRRLPDPRRLFVLGIDRPLYFSVHSASARLAPEGAAVVHVAKYLGPDAADAKAVEAELEAFCDVVQPGWRSEVASRRYLPSMLVTGALVEAGRERPGIEVDGSPLLLAGDWVRDGSEPFAMIADAAVASGRSAGLAAAARIADVARGARQVHAAGRAVREPAAVR